MVVMIYRKIKLPWFQEKSETLQIETLIRQCVFWMEFSRDISAASAEKGEIERVPELGLRSSKRIGEER